MNAAKSNSKNLAPLHSYQIAGTVARLRRGGNATRAGRRSALLGVLSSVYANASRGRTTANDSRSNTGNATER